MMTTFKTFRKMFKRAVIRVVEVCKMTEDRSYMRNHNPSKIRRIAKSFDGSKFGVPILVEHSDGKYSVVDGAHRLAAARQVFGKNRFGELACRCEVYKGDRDFARRLRMFIERYLG